ncbi:hypothetical protein [Actinoplanes sp. NBRC 101535]|uniref:dCTP deaminase n=1 Tax=Actinoplanes sp. NBRC 101535 TaxID=3032196 RepID=UPI0024A31B21|nr:hypothetical protein [Actinoplanes sp. NBRC 101535]GLY02155.1 hypothetical protein Acsp01_25340 [Actinoplanes sp. NBRC 101535]
MLTAAQITDMIDSGAMTWDGELRGDALLLRLGSPLQPLVSPGTPMVIDLADQRSIDALYRSPRPDWHSFDLKSGQLVLCPVAQPLRLGAMLAGAIAGLSHVARLGLATHVTSPWVLAGWHGHLTLELRNHGPATLRIYRGMPIGRLIVFPLSGPPGKSPSHPFYGKTDSPLGSRFADEFPSDEYLR